MVLFSKVSGISHHAISSRAALTFSEKRKRIRRAGELA